MTTNNTPPIPPEVVELAARALGDWGYSWDAMPLSHRDRSRFMAEAALTAAYPVLRASWEAPLRAILDAPVQAADEGVSDR